MNNETKLSEEQLSRNLDLVVNNVLFYLSKRNIQIENITDIITLLPMVLSNIEILLKSIKGSDKKLIAKICIETVINRTVQNEDVKEATLHFLNMSVDPIIDSMIFLANNAKIFKRNKTLKKCLKFC